MLTPRGRARSPTKRIRSPRTGRQGTGTSRRRATRAMTLAQMKPCASRAGFLFLSPMTRDFALARLGPHYCLPVWFSAPSRFGSGLKTKTSKTATGKVERRWLSVFVAAMGAPANFAPARRLLRYALDFMLQCARSCIVASSAVQG